MQLRRFDAAVAGDDEAALVDEDRIVEAERLNALGDLADLPTRMCARVARVRLEGRDGPDDELEVVEGPQPVVII